MVGGFDSRRQRQGSKGFVLTTRVMDVGIIGLRFRILGFGSGFRAILGLGFRVEFRV